MEERHCKKTNTMKNLLYRVIVVLLLLSPAVLTAQPSLYYYSYKLVPSSVVYNLNHMYGHIAVGDNGTVLRTTDGGLTFSQMQNIPVYNYNAIGSLVSGAANLYITIVGDNGKIIFAASHTYQFTEQVSPVSVNLNGVNIRNYPPLFHRIAVGDNGTIIKSTASSGFNWSNWEVVNSGVTAKLNQVSLSNLFGLIVGNNGMILRTTNKGENWTVVNSGVTNNLYSVNAYIDSSAIVCGAGGVILKSTNLGLNWTQLNSGTTADLFSVFKYVTAGSGGIVKISGNQGTNWVSILNPALRKLNSVQDYDPNNNHLPGSVIVGDSGTIIRKEIDSSYLYKILDNNSIKSFFYTTGIFDQNLRSTNTPGFEWPKGSNKYANFTSGLSTAAKVNGQLRQAMCTYSGEYYPGYCNNGVAGSNAYFRVYTIKRGDSHLSNPDWQNWGLMVPYGAPFVDVNMSGNYEPMIDTPGVKNASQTVFMCLTDGFPESHNAGEGSGGGTLPLYAELHLTAWSYSQPSYTDMQFVKFDVINKGVSPWTNTFFSLFADVDLGDAIDDYIGCDTARDLAFGYNADDNDPIYGQSPPAFGLLLLKGANNKYSSPQKQYDMTSSVTIIKYTACMGETNGEPYPAYFNMKGFKKDSTAWLDPTYTPPKKTKFAFSGDPETNIGWTNPKGVILNCNLDSTGQIISSYPGDKKLFLNTGDESITVMPGDTQRIVMCQLIARGNNNLNSVTKLKELSDIARNFYNTNYTIGINKLSSEIPTDFSLEQNYPNPFNSMTNVKFQIINSGIVKIKVYDILGKEVKTIVNEYMQPGTYNVSFDAEGLSSGVYFYRMEASNFTSTKKCVLLK
jgi:hypothetical protein